MLSHIIESSWASSGNIGSAVVLPPASLSNTAQEAPVYSGLRFDSDGNLYRFTSLGYLQKAGTWLLRGTNSDFYLSSTIDSGTLNVDAGRGGVVDLQMNANHAYNIQNSTLLTELQTVMTFKIYDNANETAPAVAQGTYTFSSTVESR